MHKVIIILIKKIVLLFIITVFPLGFYLYLDNEAQTVFKLNIDANINKYVVEVEINPDKNEINYSGKINFINKTGRIQEKIYLYIYPNVANIHEVNINEKKVDFKVIGKSDILMIILRNPLKCEEAANLQINYTLTFGNNMYHNIETGNNSHEFKIWFPMLLPHEKEGWQIENRHKYMVYTEKSRYSIKLLVPKQYKLQLNSTRKIIKKELTEKTIYYIHEDINSYLPIIIKNCKK